MSRIVCHKIRRTSSIWNSVSFNIFTFYNTHVCLAGDTINLVHSDFLTTYYVHVYLTGDKVNAVHSGLRFVERYLTKLNLT